ncbi:hypothetical protein Tco_0281198 [Tanacetum coccineum]
MVSVAKDPLTFDELMTTLIYFSKYEMNQIKIDNLTQPYLVGTVYELLKGTCRRSIELKYNMEECFKALTEKLDWTNPEEDRFPFDLTKPLPLKGHPGRLTVDAEYFFNNDLKFLKSPDPEKMYTTSVTKTKVARYEIVGIEDMVPTLWSATKVRYNKDAKRGIKHLGKKRQLWYRSQMNKFSKHNVYYTQKILSMLSVSVKKLHGYGHLEEIAVIRVDRQKSYHQTSSRGSPAWCRELPKELNITKPQKTFLGIGFKELYTPSYKPLGVIYEDLNKQKRVMRADELHKFSDGTLKTIHDELHHRILDFYMGYNKEMSRRNWTAIDKRRSKLMVELIDKQMRERQIIRNLERLVGARELKMDYRLMTQTE